MPTPSAFVANHELKPLPFDPAKTMGLSEKLIKPYWEINYGDSVKALNIVKQRLVAIFDDNVTPSFIYNEFETGTPHAHWFSCFA